MNRRGLIQGLGAALLAGAAAPGCAQRRNVRAFYACEMDIEVDGHAYTLKNGGELRIWEGSYPGNSLTSHHWYPFAATMQLPSGEVLSAIPPSPEGGIKAAFRDATRTPDGGSRDGNTDLPDASLPYLDAAYPETAVPLVYIFDRGTDSRYAEGYAMPAALLDGDTRVFSRGVRIKRVAKDVRTSASALIPWLKSLEGIAPMLASRAPGQDLTGVSNFLNKDGTPRGAPELAAYGVLLESVNGSKPFARGDRKFRSLNSALAANQKATVWIRLERSGTTRLKFTCDDPRVAIFKQEWAQKEAHMDLLSTGDELLIGGVSLVRDDKCFVCSADQMTKMLVGNRYGLRDILREPISGEFGGWHSCLSPASAGFASMPLKPN